MAVRSLRYISLCTGAGGLDLGVELAVPTARPALYMEREAFAVATLVAAIEEGLLAPTPIWSDVRTFRGRGWRGLVDGLIGGIPCQPHSLAGKRLERLDERDLWVPARRIIVQARPWFVLIENVEGMLSSGGAERVWRGLGRLGYSCEVGLFSARGVSAPHERRRVFILAVHDGLAHGGGDGLNWRAESDSLALRPEQQASRRSDADGHDLAGVGVVDPTSDGRREGWAEPEFRSGGHSPAGAACVGRTLEDARCSKWREGEPPDHVSDRDDARRQEAADRSGEPDPTVAHADVAQLRREPPARQLVVDEQDHGHGLFPPGPGDRDAWAIIAEREPGLLPAVPKSALRGLADGLAGGVDETRIDELRLLGNGVVPLEAADAFRALATQLSARSSGARFLVRLMAE